MTFTAIHQIKWKLTLVILSTSSVVLVLGALTVLIYDQISSKANLVSQMESIADIAGANCWAAVSFGVKPDAIETLASLHARGEIDLAYVYRYPEKVMVPLTADTLFAAYVRTGIKAESVTPWFSNFGSYFVHDHLIVIRNIYEGSNQLVKVGAIAICVNLKGLKARSNTFLAIALITLTGLMGVAILLATRLQRLVSGPIDHLAEVSQRITKFKDYSIRVENRSRDEIGSLNSAFNQMLSEIERQNRTLAESESRLKLALSASLMAVWEWNLQTDEVIWVRENKHLFEKVPEQLTFKEFSGLIHPEDVDWVIAAARKAVENRATFAAEYRLVLPSQSITWVAHQAEVRAAPAGHPEVMGGIVQDISARKLIEGQHQVLVAKLLQAEEEERRRIARELHDTTAQHLAVLKISLGRLMASQTATPEASLINESRQLVDQSIQEIRTLTYVLHPPLLEEFGLVGACKNLAEGVTRRNGIQVNVISDDFKGRLPRNIELTLFRVVQESITNAVRHSGTKEVLIRLARDEQEARVEVQDFGRGLPTAPPQGNSPTAAKIGVGVASMEERLSLVGGQLNIESDPDGVTVLASVPLSMENPGQPAP